MATSQSIPWTDVAREAVEHLGHILSHGTSSPPAWELPAAKYLLNLLESEGIPAVLLPPRSNSGGGGNLLCSARPNLVAHVPGSGAEEPLLLLSHLDSAPRTSNDLDLPGRLMGRSLTGPGALMGTHLAVAQAMALVLLVRTGIPLRRTVRLAATSEGAGGKGLGLRALAENHLEHITSDIALAWGAMSWTGPGGAPCSFLTTGEKGVLQMKLRSEGDGGRAGVRTGKDPVEQLAAALSRLCGYDFPPRPSDASQALVQSIAPIIPDRGLRELLDGLNRQATVDRSLRALELETQMDAGLLMLLKAALRTERNIVRISATAPDGLRPSVAEAEINYSFPPGENPEEVAREVAELLKSDGVYLSEKSVTPPSASEIVPEALALARAALHEVDPDAFLVVGLAPWPTGLGALRRYGTCVLGWEPFAIGGTLSETLTRRGGVGEMLDMEDFAREIRAFYSFLVRAAG